MQTVTQVLAFLDSRLPSVILAAVFLGACSVSPKPGATRLAPTPLGLVVGVRSLANDLDSVDLKADIPVFIVSSRNLKEEPKGIDPFGDSRSREQLPHLAVAHVQIGEDLTRDELLEQSTSELRGRKAKVEIKKVDSVQMITGVDQWKLKGSPTKRSSNPWIQALREQLDRGSSREIVIFVHGYNTHFISNTEQAASIFHNRGRDGAIISFEWPSGGKLGGYIQDKGNAEQSTRHFRGMIANVAREVDASSITVIAHSAGNPIVVNALRELRLLNYDSSVDEIRKKYRIDRVVLAAPDMDLMAFFNAVFDRFYEVAGNVAVYVSPNDRALEISSMLFNDERLGRSIGALQGWEKEVLRGVADIEMIDVSQPEEVHGSILGHSYFHLNPWVSSDIGGFMHGVRPQQRGLVRTEGSVFWEFPENYRQRLEAIAGRR